ncbi:MAG: cupin domain-containing protein [Chlorogloeopsis fritschii C42_A2020_084]|uniref:cupin domain-containing protein n=1 Tax=Chlorogloeopsis fritschii TaxID=1124 RepID=UPI001A07181A|nr:cupin domain-containing protein [Chlorogloeopsis fritschii]MBF2008268.1 cupin domain-containing protein [Chlorogloeopsis fritschii C42_A2020_084]
MPEQTFININTQQWLEVEHFPGTQILPLAEPVAEGYIHRLRMLPGTVIPIHFHPCDEYVYVLDGTIETGGRECKKGTFWFTPAKTKNGPHKAITSVELLTIRLGAMGTFEEC